MKERIQEKTETTLLEQTIYPFKPGNFAFDAYDGGIQMIYRGTLIYPDGIETLPLGMECELYSVCPNNHAVMPFEPERGYVVDARDYDIGQRGKKITEAANAANYETDKSTRPLLLSISLTGLDAIENDTRNIQCVVVTNGLFVATLIQSPWLPNTCHFENFFPADAGPMPGNSYSTDYDHKTGQVHLSPGNHLHFNKKDERLSKIGVTFIKRPMQPQFASQEV